MKCGYCEQLVEGKSYRVEGDGYCVVCQDKIFSNEVNVIYTGLLRGFHRFKTEGMSICASCGSSLDEMTLPCSDQLITFSKRLNLVETGE